MAKCPKCAAKLNLWNISQFCPKCGVNMRFYGFEEKFYRDAKNAELAHAAFHIKVRHFKGALVGSKLMIARFALAFLPLVVLLLPAGNFHFEMPFKEADFSAGLLGIVNLVMGTDLGFIFGMGGSALAGAEFGAVTNALIAYAVVAVAALGVLICSLLGFLSIKNMQKVICGFATGGILASIVAQVVMYISVGSLKESVMLTGEAGFGLYLSIVAFAVVFFINLKIHKNGVPVVYDEGMVERAEIYKKVKAGEISIDDLPQPVVETEETRKIEEEIRKEEENVQKALAERAREEAKSE